MKQGIWTSKDRRKYSEESLKLTYIQVQLIDK